MIETEENQKPASKKNQIAFMVFLFLFVIAVFSNPLWHDPDGARKTLEDAGYKHVEILPYKFFGYCGRIGPFITHFKAQKADGEMISGKVCSNFFGDPYIRMD